MPANGPTGRGQGGPPGPGCRPAELGLHGMGFVKVVKENFGFIGSPELGEQLFFHASEVVTPDDFEGSKAAYFSQHLAAGDEVAFVVGTGQRGNIVGQQVKKLPVNSVKALLLSEERYQGRVVTELNSGQWRSEDSSSGKIEYQEVGPGGKPQGETATIQFHVQDVYKLRHRMKRGTLVDFSICTDNQTRERRAVHIEMKTRAKAGEESGGGAAGGGSNETAQPKLLHGFVKTLKPPGGTIRCIEQEKRYPFKMELVPPQHQATLAVGSETMFSVFPDARGNDIVGSIAILVPGTLQKENVSSSPQPGRVVKPYSEMGPTPGVILSGYQNQIRFDPGPLEGGEGDATSLKAEDEVEFLMVEDYKADRLYAKNIRLVARAEEKRELGKVRTLKSNFGFIACCQRSGQVFFHFSSVQGCRPEELQKNDDVEFSVARDPEHGTIAVRVRRVAPGTAVFETVSEEVYEGVIQTPMYNISPLVLSSGVVSYQCDGAPAKLLFGEHDFKEAVTVGEVVTFRIADNLLAAKQAEKLGATVSRLIGRRATEGSRLRLQGSVKSSNGSSGFLRYDAKGVEKKVYFHINSVAEKLELKAGDEVAFGLAINQKTKEVNARQIVRTKESSAQPLAEVSRAATPPPGDANPARRKPLQLNNPSNSVSVAAARPTPAMPDGTKGFTFGRGVGMKPPTATVSSVPQASGAVNIPRAPGKPANGVPGGNSSLGGRTPSESSLGRRHGAKGPSADARGRGEVARVGVEAKAGRRASPKQGLVTSLMARTSSGRALNPDAADFMPRTASGSTLVPPAEDTKPPPPS